MYQLSKNGDTYSARRRIPTYAHVSLTRKGIRII